MIHFNAGILQVKYGIHLCMHGRFQQGRIIECQSGVIGKLRKIDPAQGSQLWCIGQPEEIENRIPAQCLGLTCDNDYKKRYGKNIFQSPTKIQL